MYQIAKMFYVVALNLTEPSVENKQNETIKGQEKKEDT